MESTTSYTFPVQTGGMFYFHCPGTGIDTHTVTESEGTNLKLVKVEPGLFLENFVTETLPFRRSVASLSHTLYD